MYAEESEEQPNEITNQEISLKHSVLSTFATQASTPTNFNVPQQSSFVKFVQTPKTSDDISLQVKIFSENAEILGIAVEQYLKIWFGQKLYEIPQGVPTNIVAQNNGGEDDDQEFIYELIVTKNDLLSRETQLKICNYIQQYQQIISLFRQLQTFIGSTLLQQFAFIISNLLILKLDSYKKLQNHQIEEIIPQLERFGGDEGQQELLPNGWQIYEDIDYASIKKFSVDHIKQIAVQLYFTSQLKYLNLSSVEVNNNQAIPQFCGLVGFFAQTLFLTMSSMRQQNQDLQEFLQLLKMDRSDSEIQRLLTSIPKSIQNNKELL